MKRRMLWAIMLSMSVCGLLRAVDPVIYLPFDGDLKNYGTAGPETGRFTEEGGLTPGFGPGVLGGALDFRMAPDPNITWNTEGGYAVINAMPMGRAVWGVYDEKAHDPYDPCTWPIPGDPCSIDPELLAGPAVDTPMELALDDAVSMTLMMWLKCTGPNGYREGTTMFCRPHPSNPITGETAEYYRGAGAIRLVNLHDFGSMRLYANGDKSENVFPNIEQSANSTWRFIAVTYDGTEGFFPITWYTGWLDEETLSVGQTARLNNVWITPGGPISLGKHEPIAIGNRFPPPYGNVPFKGMVDEVRVFVSKTDDSGALTRAQIMSYYLEAFSAPSCGDSAHANPVGDLNYDCKVDTQDLGLFIGNWLEQNSE